MYMLPELIIVATAFAILAMDLIFLKGDKRLLFFMALAGNFFALVACFWMLRLPPPLEMLGGRFVFDSIGGWLKIVFLTSSFLLICVSTQTFQKSSPWGMSHPGEFITVLFLSLSGMMYLVSSRDLVMIYVSLELATLPLMALSAWSKTAKSGEAGIKYLAIGALASALLLYGFGYIYGLTGHTSLAEIASQLQPEPSIWLAMGLILSGLGFKLTLVPFHMWSPDTYEGAPTPVTAFLSVASKATGLGISVLLIYKVFGQFLTYLSLPLAILSALTMSLGNLVAVTQKNLKRYMAYSAISQAGYLIMGFLGSSGLDLGAMIFYIFVYALTNLAAFGVIIAHTHQTGREDIDSMAGLSQKNPVLSLVMMSSLFGLAGIPPLAGFVGKFFLFNVAAKAGYYWLVLLAAINSTISLYYYLRIVRQMYIEAPTQEQKPLKTNLIFNFGLFVAALGSILGGIIPHLYQKMGSDAAIWLSQVWYLHK